MRYVATVIIFVGVTLGTLLLRESCAARSKLKSARITVSDSLAVNGLRVEKLPLRVYGGVSTIHVDATAGVDSIFIGDRLIYDATDSLRAFRIYGREYKVRPGFYVVTDSAVYCGGPIDSSFIAFIRGSERRLHSVVIDPAAMSLERVK